MKLDIIHYPQRNTFEANINGLIPYVEYTLSDNTFDIIHTIVPKQLEGQGIAGQIVSHAYHYAKEKGYQLKGSCSYAEVWLQRHPM